MSTPRPPATVTNRVVAAICVAQILGMSSYSTVPALLSEFMTTWRLSNAEGGWLAGVLFAGYVGSVLVVVALSDRMPARRIYLVFAALGVLASVLMAWADGFAQALALRALAGISLAGTYMPGLKALSEHLDGERRARVVAWYTVAFTVGAGLSFILAGHVAASGGWRIAFLSAAAAGAVGFLLALLCLPAPPAAAEALPADNPWNFIAVLRNRAAMGFVLAYAAVIWACAGVRQWLVVFLETTRPGDGAWVLDVYLVAALANVVGVPAGLLGNELGIRAGFRRGALWMFLLAALASVLMPLSFALSAVAALVLVLLYAFIVQDNVSNLTAGTVAVAERERAGATMALHSFIGFSGGMLGPLCFGLVLDGAGGAASQLAWSLAYGSCGLVCVAGAVSLLALGRERQAPPDTGNAGRESRR